MLDIHPREIGAPRALPGVEFLRIELTPLVDGGIFVSLTATTVDDEEPQLLDQEIASDRVATIEAALAFISEHAHLVFHASIRKEH
jgi:hypothetical protein